MSYSQKYFEFINKYEAIGVCAALLSFKRIVSAYSRVETPVASDAFCEYLLSIYESCCIFGNSKILEFTMECEKCPSRCFHANTYDNINMGLLKIDLAIKWAKTKAPWNEEELLRVIEKSFLAEVEAEAFAFLVGGKK